MRAKSKTDASSTVGGIGKEINMGNDEEQCRSMPTSVEEQREQPKQLGGITGRGLLLRPLWKSQRQTAHAGARQRSSRQSVRDRNGSGSPSSSSSSTCSCMRRAWQTLLGRCRGDLRPPRRSREPAYSSCGHHTRVATKVGRRVALSLGTRALARRHRTSRVF